MKRLILILPLLAGCDRMSAALTKMQPPPAGVVSEHDRLWSECQSVERRLEAQRKELAKLESGFTRVHSNVTRQDANDRYKPGMQRQRAQRHAHMESLRLPIRELREQIEADEAILEESHVKYGAVAGREKLVRTDGEKGQGK